MISTALFNDDIQMPLISIKSFSLFLLLLIPTIVGANLVGNPGFEEGFSVNGVALNWTNNTFGTSTVTFSSDSETTHAGRFAQKINCSSYSNGAIQFAYRGGICILRGKPYELKVWLKGTVNGKVGLQLRKWGTPYTSYCIKEFSITDEWKEYSFVDFSIGNDEQSALFIFFSSVGTLMIDDVSCDLFANSIDLTNFKPQQIPIPEYFFGMHMHRAWYKTEWPDVTFKTWRLWDSYVTWDQIEPTKGNWNFNKVDTYFKLADSFQVDIIMPLSNSPTWASARPDEASPYGLGASAEPADSNDWKHYVRTLATYCKNKSRGRVKYFEIWNEPSFKSGSFFTGTIEKLVELSAQAYRIVKEIDPSYQVISSSIVANPPLLDSFMAAGAKEWCDIVGYHFYTSTPEKILTHIGNVRLSMLKYGIANKPLWNTEAGWALQDVGCTWPNTPFVTQKEAAEYIVRNYILNWASGVHSYCFYSWDNQCMGTLDMQFDGTNWAPVSERTVLKTGLKTAHEWLNGAIMTTCKLDSSTGTWCAELLRDSTIQTIIWNPDSEVTYILPPNINYTRLRTMSGVDSSISKLSAIRVSAAPLLLTATNIASAKKVGINDHKIALKAHPVPANPSITFTIKLPAQISAQYVIYNTSGQIVWQRAVPKTSESKTHLLHWHGETTSGQSLSSGIYFGKLLTSNNARISNTIILVR